MFSFRSFRDARAMPPKKAKAPDSDAAAAVPNGPENLDTVRDILFGGHMRAVEGRMARIEERLAREQAAMRAELEKTLSGLEAFTRKELEALGEKLKVERAKRADELKALGADIKEQLKSLDRRLAQIDETTGRADAELRSQLLEQQRETAAELKRVGDTLPASCARPSRPCAPKRRTSPRCSPSSPTWRSS
jgi:hypothetical protein